MGDDRDGGVPDGEEAGGGRDGPVALAVGDRVGVRSVARHGVAEAEAEPPDHDGGEQGQAERHRGDLGAADVDAGAVGRQPAQGADPQPVARRAVRPGVGEEPADHAPGQAHQQGGPGRGDPRQRRQQDERTPVRRVGTGVVRSGTTRGGQQARS